MVTISCSFIKFKSSIAGYHRSLPYISKLCTLHRYLKKRLIFCNRLSTIRFNVLVFAHVLLRLNTQHKSKWKRRMPKNALAQICFQPPHFSIHWLLALITRNWNGWLKIENAKVSVEEKSQLFFLFDLICE